MAFHVSKTSLNHSPQWYRDRRLDEDSSISLVALINADTKLLDVDDATLTPGEKLGIYEEAWNRILSGTKGNVDIGDLSVVMEREALAGFRPKVEYANAGFRSIAKAMKKHGITGADVRAFLKWTAKNENLKKARDAKTMKVKKLKSLQKPSSVMAFLQRKRDGGSSY